MPSIKTVLDLDTSKFSQGVDVGARKFQAAFGPGGTATKATGLSHVGEELTRKLERGFGIGEIFKAGLTGFLGFATVERLVDKVREHYAKIAESARNIAEQNRRGAEAIDRLKDFFRSDPQKLTNLQTKFKAGLQEMKVANAPTLGGLDYDHEGREKAAKISADLRENLLQQAELRKRIAEARAAEAVKVRAVEKSAEDERHSRRYDEMDLDEKLFHQKLAQLNAQKAAELASNPLERAQAHLALEKAITEEKKVQAQIDKDAQDAWDRALEEDKKARDEINQLEEKREDAEKNVAKAKAALAHADVERTKISLDDAASGRAGTPTEQAQARRLTALEARARQVRNRGNEMRDDSGHTVSAETYARGLLKKADDMRLGMTGLKEQDRNPNKALLDSLGHANEHLKEIEKSLKPTTTGGAGDKK